MFMSLYLIDNIKSVNADSVYARIISDNTPFYQTEEAKSPLFYLPYTYYVKILKQGETLTHVECYGDGNTAALDGFVPTDMLFYDGLKVENPFVVLDITTVDTAVLYQDANLKTQTQYIFENRNMHYYGWLNSDNGKVFYVSYNDKLGYIKEADVFPFSIPNHPNELTFITPEIPEEPPKDTSNTNDDFFGIKVAIIVCLTFAGIVALLFAISKRRNPNLAISYYDDNDYE